jgi:hypothetical protein
MAEADLQPTQAFGRRAREVRAAIERRDHAPRDVAMPAGEPPQVAIPRPQHEAVDATIKKLIPMNPAMMLSISTREPRNTFINANRPKGAELNL